MPKPKPNESKDPGASREDCAARGPTGAQEAGTPASRAEVQPNTGDFALRESQQQLIKSNAALIALNQKLEEATLAKSQFLANISQEIRNPMNEILGMSALFLETELTSQQREFVGATRSRAEALLALVNDVLDFSRIQSGRFELEPHPFELHTCIEEAFDLLATQAAEKDLELAYFIDEAIPPILVSDLTRLRQVLVNLVGYAVRNTHQGELVVEVVCASHALRDHQTGPAEPFLSPEEWELHFSVHSAGMGVPRDLAHRLLRLFQQADSSSAQPSDGTELGLVLSRRLVELLGGKLSVEGQAGKSLTFHFSVAAHAAATTSPPASQESQPWLAGKQLLVVEPNTTLCRMIAQCAGRWGVETTSAATGTEALVLLEQTPSFDAALLDLQLPDQDGLTLAAAIRTQLGETLLPLLLLSPTRFRDDDPLPQQAGISSTVQKPIRPAQLLEALVRALSQPPLTATLPAAQPPEPSPSEHRPLRLLLADDNPINQKVGLSVLQKLGFRADLAHNGFEVLQALELKPYDIVFLDVQMPELDGLDTARRICRRWPPGQRPRLIAITGNALQEDREKCLLAGMDDYISKPIRIGDLREALRRWEATKSDRPLPPPAQSAPGFDLLDGALLDELREMPASEGVTMLQELAELFVASAPERIAQIAQALEDPSKLVFHAQALKSMSQDLGAKRMIQLSERLEDAGRSGRTEDASALLRELETAFALTRDQLRAFCQES